jgi:glycosyltransferase involved in cell wall biosynthesis
MPILGIFATMHFSIALLAIYTLGFWCFIQIFYYLFFFLRLVLHKNYSAAADSQEHFSIIICAKNEETNISKHLEYWITQQYHNLNGEPMYEVILVDDNSDDGSNYLFQDLAPKYKHLRIVSLRQEAKGIRGKKFPLSMGIKEAKYENLLLTDADCAPASNLWLQQIANSYQKQNTQVVLSYGAYRKYNGFLNKWIRWETAMTAMQYLSYALAKIPYMGVGRNLSYKKELFIANKGFSSHTHLLSGDDDLFINQVANGKNTRININPNAFTYSEPKKTYDAWFFQKRRHLTTGKYYKGIHQFFLGLFSASHFLFFAAFIWALFYPKFYIITAGIFIIRWIVQYIIFAICFKKLGEYDLIPSIWLFDIYTLIYNIRMLPALFTSNKEWK